MILAGVGLAAAAAAGWYATRPVGQPPALAALAEGTDPAAIDTSRVREMSLGAEDAPVTVIEYASFTCPHCAAFHREVMPRLRAEYIDTGKVRLIYREVYFDRFGLWAAMIARCGGPERYFGIVSLLYERQRDWLGDGDPATVAANLRTLGISAGLEAEAVDACLADGAMAQAMVAVYQKNATADGVQSTPSFIVNGVKHSNMPWAEFAALIDAELGR
jgi:protein-disulfide isomerase